MNLMIKDGKTDDRNYLYVVEPLIDEANIETKWEGSIMSLKSRIDKSQT